jgi:hypothetical protein
MWEAFKDVTGSYITSIGLSIMPCSKIDRPIEIGKRYAIEMNVEKNKVMRSWRQPSPMKIMIDQKQLENVEYLSYLGSVITYDVRCTSEIKSRIVMAKAAFNKNKTLFTSNWT